MMQAVQIRHAYAEDLEALCRLYVAFHEFHVRGVPDRLASLGDPESFDCRDLVATLGQLLADEDCAIFVAEAGARIVGMAEVHLRRSAPGGPEVERSHGYLQTLFVLEDLRRHGLGARLLTAAEEWARLRGADEMQLEVWEFPAGPLPFYSGAGYRTLRRTLVGPL